MSSTSYCPFCEGGVRWPGEDFCWDCGVRAQGSAHLALCQLSAAVTSIVLLEAALHGNAQCSREVRVDMLQGQQLDAMDIFERLMAGWPVITEPAR